jgi:hypothetical protein
MTDLEVIPRHAPEVVEALARKYYFGDDEKVPTTTIRELIVAGVQITSRYQKAHELELMRTLIMALPPRLASAVRSIWCDSKANYCFSIVLRCWNRTIAELIGNCIEETLRNVRPFGHNGIDIGADEKRASPSIYLDPKWGDYDEHLP